MPNVQQLFSVYLARAAVTKGRQARAADRRRAELWTRVLGGDRDARYVSWRDCEDFVAKRAQGAIDSRGRQVRGGSQHPVRDRTVQADCLWLKSVFRWATTWRTDDGSLLLETNPITGFRPPRERNPRRPTATPERYRRIRAVSDRVPMEIRWRGRREPCRSHLSEILDLAHHTGRRLSAICALTYADLELAVGPHGSIRWPARTDKTRRELVVPLSPAARAAIDRVMRERPGHGPLPLFPSPTRADRAMSRHLADDWLRRAERLAGVEPLAGSLWHAYRRGWATARKQLPDVDVAAAGGWKDAYTLKTVYQQPDPEGMLRAVLGEG